MIKVGIVGATGYTGAELVRILHGHPKAEITVLTSRSHEGENIEDIYPNLRGCVDHSLSGQDLDKVISISDVVFVALPHGLSVPIVKKALEAGKKVIDLGADFRLKDAEVYKQWYGLEHGAPNLLENAAYGLPELKLEEIKDAQIVANPGCFPTGVILGLAPLLDKGIIDPKSIIADSKTGLSGAGKTPTDINIFVECNENAAPYAVNGHRHRPEMEQELGWVSGDEVQINFIPHLVPITRGILSTIYGGLTSSVEAGQVREIYEDYYSGAPFIRLLDENIWPHTRWVKGSNFCDLNFFIDKGRNRITIVSAIDNLFKGASGQAVQNMNIMFGLPQDMGLKFPGLCP
ncbi:MAG: N-acetyl-gamma-glutamyl-phosphate reductase [Clostridia bacterium]|nr:N-acetyl-gamma-glutamyl-phosphate reductase [Clostridia bacterium]